MWRSGLLAALLGVSCAREAPRPEPTSEGAAVPLALSAFPPASVEVPGNVRPEGRPPVDDVPLLGPWTRVATQSGRTTWETPLPIRPRALFFFRPLPGMKVRDASGRALPHRSDHGGKGASWRFNARTLTLTLPEEDGAPEPGAYTLRYPRATSREARLNQELSGLSPLEYIHASVQVGPTTRSGVLLPPPGHATWEVDVPAAAELHFAVGLVPPETLDAAPSDGAGAFVEVDAGAGWTALWQGAVTDDAFAPVRVDLSAHAGQRVKLRLRTEPSGSPTFDYVLFADPTVAPRRADPRRVVLIFVDTLRPDHLGLYGYDRPTSPSLDAFAQGAVTFTDARSVAPWTLPSTRTLVTGRHPEEYDVAVTLPRRLREQGFATAMFAGNVYLSSNFDMDRDWATHRVVNKPSAATQVDLALDWLDAQDGRDALLLLHFMDAHLDYREPLDYRFLFAGQSPNGLGERFSRGAVLRAGLKTDDERQYILDRYDNTIRYVHDELQRLFDQLGPDDVVVYFADHGEEFWEHGGYEHGHTLYDELLRVPLVIRAPGLPPGRVDSPVSLLDVTPTVLDALEIPADDLDGWTLLPAGRGDKAALDALDARSQVVGRPLYGHERWGVVADDHKWTTLDNRSELYDLAADPAEQKNLLKPPDDAQDARWMAAGSQALGRPLVRGLRFLALRSSSSPKLDLTATAHVPGGVIAAWVGADPTDASSASVEVDGDEVHITWHRGFSGAREVFVLPAQPPDALGDDLAVALDAGKSHADMKLKPIDGTLSGRATVGRATAGGRQVQLTLGVAPLPDETTGQIRGFDPEVASMLQALGYMEEDAPSPESSEAPE